MFLNLVEETKKRDALYMYMHTACTACSSAGSKRCHFSRACTDALAGDRERICDLFNSNPESASCTYARVRMHASKSLAEYEYDRHAQSTRVDVREEPPYSVAAAVASVASIGPRYRSACTSGSQAHG